MKCLKCSSFKVVKNGTKHGEQYYKCNICHIQFNETTRLAGQLKQYAIVLYCYGFSLRTIGQALGYSNVAVLNWVKEYANTRDSQQITKQEILDILGCMSSFLHAKRQDLLKEFNRSIDCEKCKLEMCQNHMEHVHHDCDECCLPTIYKPKDCNDCNVHYCKEHNGCFRLLKKIDDIISGKAEFEIPIALQNYKGTNK
ncbi:MAG: hypothetical protein FWF56_02990 [Firmicutes bacterium]|nr:hypothetical protein [Bacillota bacterium]MCL1954027.1 hypothetical protein [Bacillota bacterium]